MDATADASRTAKPFGIAGLCLSLIGLALLGCLVTAAIGALAAVFAGLAMGWSAFGAAIKEALAGSANAEATRTLLIVILIFYVGLAVAILIAAHWRAGKHWRDLVAWRRFRLADRTIWAIILAALAYSALANSLAARFLPNPAIDFAVPSDPFAAVVLAILAAVVAPVTEELLFRGWIYTSLRLRWGLWPALLVSSVLFAGAHYEKTHVYAVAVFPIGVALGVVRERAGSVKASILFHALNNFAAVALSALSGS